MSRPESWRWDAPARPVRRPNGWSNGVDDREPPAIEQAPASERARATAHRTGQTSEAGVDEELTAILARATRAGIDPRRVLLALGLAPRDRR